MAWSASQRARRAAAWGGGTEEGATNDLMKTRLGKEEGGLGGQRWSKGLRNEDGGHGWEGG